MKRLLLLEDNMDMVGLVKQFLPKYVEVTHVENGKQGLEAISKGDKFDLIISDYNMPIMDGIEFLNELRSSDKTTPAFLYTGNPALASSIIDPTFVNFVIAKDDIVRLVTETELLLAV